MNDCTMPSTEVAAQTDCNLLCPTLAGLLKWVFAMVNYYGVAKGVEPKRKKVQGQSCGVVWYMISDVWS